MFENPGLAAAKLTFDSVDLFADHYGIEIERSLYPAMTVAAMRLSGTVGEIDLASGTLKDAADLLVECLTDGSEDELRVLFAETSSGGGAAITEGPFTQLSGRHDLIVAAAIVHDAVQATSEPDYLPMTEAVSFLAHAVPGYVPEAAPSPALAF